MVVGGKTVLFLSGALRGYVVGLAVCWRLARAADCTLLVGTVACFEIVLWADVAGLARVVDFFVVA